MLLPTYNPTQRRQHMGNLAEFQDAHEYGGSSRPKEEQEAKAHAAEQAKIPLDERVREDIDLVKQFKDEARENECQRWEAIANTQMEAAQTMERAAEEFGNHIANLEATLNKDRRSRREFS
jgi:hypothetical protein